MQSPLFQKRAEAREAWDDSPECQPHEDSRKKRRPNSSFGRLLIPSKSHQSCGTLWPIAPAARSSSCGVSFDSSRFTTRLTPGIDSTVAISSSDSLDSTHPLRVTQP